MFSDAVGTFHTNQDLLNTIFDKIPDQKDIKDLQSELYTFQGSQDTFKMHWNTIGNDVNQQAAAFNAVMRGEKTSNSALSGGFSDQARVMSHVDNYNKRMKVFDKQLSADRSLIEDSWLSKQGSTSLQQTNRAPKSKKLLADL